MISAIHIDDDLRSLKLMKLTVADIAELELKASFTSGDRAMQWLANNNADIVFLAWRCLGKTA